MSAFDEECNISLEEGLIREVGQRFLNVFVILIYPWDVNVGHLLNKFRNASDDR